MAEALSHINTLTVSFIGLSTIQFHFKTSYDGKTPLEIASLSHILPSKTKRSSGHWYSQIYGFTQKTKK